MEIEKILTLIDKVSASGLTEFTLEEGNLQLCMKKEKGKETNLWLVIIFVSIGL